MAEERPAEVAEAPSASVRLGRGDLGDDELMIEMWARSRSRARERHAAVRSQRRRRQWRLAGGLLLAGAFVVGAVALILPALDLGDKETAQGPKAGPGIADRQGAERPAGPNARSRPASAGDRSQRPPIVPVPGSLKEAWGYAQSRGGEVSIAIVDTRGRLRGEAANRLYSAASVVKSMLLAAELRRLEREGLALDAQTASLLRAMITYSDNAAADAIYSRVGDAGLFEVARLTGMSRFTVAGHWGNAQITAAEMARMFSDLDRVFAGPQRKFALGLLGSVVDEQRWGIPAAAGDRWAVRFKGGWVMTDHGQVTHQAAELRDGDRLLSMAILTDEQPSMAIGTETIRGAAERLLSRSGDGGPASRARPGS
jgi:hypothetical protein